MDKLNFDKYDEIQLNINYRLIMIFNPAVETFREVVRHGSFTAAASALGISGAATSKQIKLLEEKLGFRLFNRTTRNVQPTEAARRLNALLSENAEQLATLLAELSSEQERPTGRLRLNVPMSFGELFLRKPIAEYALAYPDVVVDVDFEDRRVHLIEEGFDLVVRIGVLEDSGLIATRVGDCPLYLCASPQFVERHGGITDPAQIPSLPAIIYSNSDGAPSWSCQDRSGQVHSHPLRPVFYANSAGMMLEACRNGIGLAVLPSFSCQHDIDNGNILRLFPQMTTAPERGIYAIYPDRRYLPLKVRTFIELLQGALG